MIRSNILKKMIILFLFVSASFLFAVDRLDLEGNISPEDIKKAVEEVKEDSLTAQKGFDDLVKDMEKIEGLFTLYRDNEEGTVYLQINPDQFEKIYLCTMTRQSGDAYIFDASSMLWNFPFFFKKINKRIQLIQKNLDFRAEGTAMHKAIEKCLSNSIVASTSIVGKPQEETGAILIKASDLFLKDMTNVESITDHYKLNYSFDKDNSYFGKLKSFPLNTEIDVILHFKSSKWRNIYTLPDSRSMIHHYHYSLSEIQKTNYKPRLADDRIGCFTTIFQDYTDLLNESPYIRYINRWHIEKENPKAKVSKAKEPIVFWLENTIPPEFRPAVRKGILIWNDAFEKIGIIDAIVVKEMPDDADWDPADARYNTICWIVQPGGGYAVGPSHANPYTGQLYDADVRISIDFIRFFSREFGELIEPGAWEKGLRSANWEKADINRFYEGDAFAEGLAGQMAYGWDVLSNRGFLPDTKEEMKKYVEQGIIALVVHEVGHTLGFRHNFKASTYYTLEQLQDKKFTEKNGVSGSVMDYNPLNLAPINGKQGNYFQTQLGTWDYWVVEYAYSIFEPEKEEKELKKITKKCTQPLLDYGTDEDAYGMSVRGIDPSCNMFDLGKDIIASYESRLQLARKWWKDIPKNFEKKGKQYKKFLSVFNQSISEYNSAAHNVSKYIGGLYAHRDHIGDPHGRPPYEVVPAKEQRRALNFLTKNILAEDAFSFDPELLNKLVPEKMWKFTRSIWAIKRPDYPIHSTVGWLQSIVFAHLYDPLVLSRLHDNELKFKPEEEKFTMTEMFISMNKTVWSELAGNKNINSYRRELQRIHLHCLSDLILKKESKIPNDAVSLARANLKDILEQIEEMYKADLSVITKAHLEESYAKIDAVLSAQIKIK